MSHVTKQSSLLESPHLKTIPATASTTLQILWKMLRNHRDTDLYWFFEDDTVSSSKNSGIITEWVLIHLVDFNITTPLK